MDDTVERLAGKPHSNKPGKRMLTTREAAERLGIKVDSVPDAANRGLMTGARKVDGLWVIPEQAVEHYRTHHLGNTALLRAEIEALRAEVDRLRDALRELEEREQRDEARVMADKLTTELAACDVARPPTPVGWSDTDWIKHLQDQEPHPLAGLHINQGSMNAAADAYEAEYNAAQEARRAEHDAARKEGCMTEDRDDRIERGRTAEEKAAALEPWAHEPDVDAATMLRLIKTIKYLVGIAERGEGRKIADDETPEQFVLGYVKRLEQTNQDASAELREKNGVRA